MPFAFDFPATFTFGRPTAAPYLDAAGLPAVAEPNQPRIDHDEAGVRIGLLVSPGEQLGDGDRCRVKPGEWEKDSPATIFHHWRPAGGEDIRQAHYSLNARATLDALLASSGHHLQIGAVPGHLRNRGGFVRYREHNWALPVAIGAEPGIAIGDGDISSRPLLEG